MKIPKIWLIAAVAALAVFAGALMWKRTPAGPAWIEIRPHVAEFVKKVSATGSVTPESRIVVTAPINGRIDRILADDGRIVKKGEVLAWMSSQDRAALMDAMQTSRRGRGSELSQMYKPTPIVAPEGGQIISRSVVRGQNVGVESVLFEISDRLIFLAKVDETDLGKIALDQPARIWIDAFPGQVVEAKTHHIVHQSSLNNNITTYDVYVEPTGPVTGNLRSGMSISVDFILIRKDDALLVPAFLAEGRQNVRIPLTVRGSSGEAESRDVQIGAGNGEFVEVLEGLKTNDVVLYREATTDGPRGEGAMGLFGRKRK